jgi:penicillin-insensitive murein DD-endopeptidase
MHSPLQIAIALTLMPMATMAQDSTCFGTVSNGRLENGIKLPISGKNFSSYSSTASIAGRTYVHSQVARVIEDSYKNLEKALPKNVFVYGETGWSSGGRFRPHRTHQNGLSVDFFVPVKNIDGVSVAIPTSATTRFGYDLEFDAQAKLGNLTIDFTALAEHLYQLNLSAQKLKTPIKLVIFDPVYFERLFATPRGASIRSLPFMKGKPWVRHDEHFHIDFDVPCQKLSAEKK